MFVAGNWKMNTSPDEAVALAAEVRRAIGDPKDVQVALCPPFVYLQAVGEMVKDSRVALGAQTMHEADSGAFTGEISAPMLTGLGCRYVILGHSERRQFFGETDAGVNAKIKQALQHGLVPIVCVGELLNERDSGEARTVVERQVRQAFAGVTVASPEAVVIAYEPVWAIGTGRTATPEQAQEMHAAIREWLLDLFGDTGRAIQILYGGSVKPGNAAELFHQPDVDGGLIGGASLDAADFAAIVRDGQMAMEDR